MTEIYAAIEMAKGETPHGTVHRFMQAAVERNLLFSRLEVLDVFTIGIRKFVRFRSDQADLDLLTQDLRKDRAVVIPNGRGYKVYIPGGQEASVPMTKMHVAPLPNYKRVYRGPKSDLWEAQFSDV